jgi:AcrR family transcriptional regulator
MSLFKSDNRILKGADELFCRFGIKNVTMDDIARHLGVSKKTLYQHYEDKNKIVVSVIENGMGEHELKFCEFEKASKNAIEEILHTMHYMSSVFATVNPNVFYDMQRYHPEAWQIFRKFKEEKVLHQIIRNLEKGREQGLYRMDFSIKILARLRLEEIELGMNPTLYPADKYNLHDVNIQLLEHYLYGICTLKGHKLINKHKQLIEEED